MYFSDIRAANLQSAVDRHCKDFRDATRCASGRAVGGLGDLTPRTNPLCTFPSLTWKKMHRELRTRNGFGAEDTMRNFLCSFDHDKSRQRS